MFISISVLIELKKEYVVNAGIEKIWNFLTNLKEVTSCIPNLENLQIETPTKFRGKIKPPFSFVRGRLNIESEVQGFNEKERLTIAIKGTSIGASFRGTMQITLSAGTKIQVDAKVETFGLLRTIPKSLIYKIVEDIETPVLKCIKGKLE
jgi:hypothetical protein